MTVTFAGVTFGPSSQTYDGRPQPTKLYEVTVTAAVTDGPTFPYEYRGKTAQFVVDQAAAGYELVRSEVGRRFAWQCHYVAARGFHLRADGTYGGRNAARGFYYWQLRPWSGSSPLADAPFAFRRWAALHNPGMYGAIAFARDDLLVDVEAILASLAPETHDPGDDRWGGANLDPGTQYDHQETR